MDTDAVIDIRGVSKKYRLFRSTRERFMEAIHPFRKRFHHEFWALRDVTLQVHKGQGLGLVGVNGSGKSTLLRVASGIVKPTEGTVQVHARLAALLALGAGLNAEFTGRENVSLQGAMMGLSHREIHKQFDRIEAFADIGEFIDQPVRTYSAGMRVRLTFSVACFLATDVIIADEALSVGDAFFKAKCYQRVTELRQSGTTFLVASHSPGTIEALCDRVIVLDGGRIAFEGPTAEALALYRDLRAERRGSPLRASAEDG